MSIRRGWTEEEDITLKLLKQERKVKKWSSIAKLMDFEFNLCGRNGKQCRQRYNNRLEDGIVEKKLSQEQERLFLTINHQIGNKWAVIALAFKGRTANYLKNKLYSKLRKSIRKLNKFIKDSKIKDIKPFKLNIVFKIAQSNDFKIFEKQRHTELDLAFYAQLKEKLFRYAQQPQPLEESDKAIQSDTINQSRQLMEGLVQFNKKYEQLNKRVKKSKKRYFSQDDIILNSLSNNKISRGNLQQNLQLPYVTQSEEQCSKMQESDSDESSWTSLKKQSEFHEKSVPGQNKVTQTYDNAKNASQSSKEKQPSQAKTNSIRGQQTVPNLQQSAQNQLMVSNQNSVTIEHEQIENNNRFNLMLQESQQCQFLDIQYLDHFKSHSLIDESLFQ